MRFIESIRYKDGEYHNLILHQERMDRTFERFMPEIKAHDLSKILPKLELRGTYKVRVVYYSDTEDANYDLEYAEYIPRKIETLKLVETNAFDYSFKFEDRKDIENLIDDQADDMVIVINGNITDGSYFNLAFWNGTEWHTPDTPLLRGVRRDQLLDEGRIQEVRIMASDLKKYQKVSLINAMLDLGELEVPIENVS